MMNTAMSRRTFVAASALLLAGCGSRGQAASSSAGGQAAASESASSGSEASASAASSSAADVTSANGAAAPAGAKILVAYYSRAGENYPKEWLEVGHTKVMAGYIAEALGADSYEIVPTNAYPEGYEACCDVALEEQKANARPAIAGELPDVSGYDVVFIGCPIWWGDEPMIIRSFLDGVDLSGKTVVPFTTHGGSGLGNVPTNLQAALPSARFLDALAVEGTSVDSSREQVVSWATGLSLA